MPQVIVDPFNNAASWTALAPDGVTPSTQLSMANDTLRFHFGADNASAKISASASALNHTLRRSLPNLNLANFDDLRLWIYADRGADGTPARPFYLELRLASATMPLTNPANTWKRFLPVANPGMWDFVRFHLDDLPAAVRGAVNLVQLRVADAGTGFTCNLDDFLGVREEMIGDVDAALLALLDSKFISGGNPVPALLTLPEKPSNPGIPSIRITQYDVQYDREHTIFNQLRGDYSGSSFRLNPVSIHYDVYYFIDVYGNTRREKTQIMEFVLQTISPRSELVINGTQQLLEWVAVDPFNDRGEWRADRELFYFKVAVRQEVGVFQPAVPPYTSITVFTDQQARP